MNLPTIIDSITGEVMDGDAVAIGELYDRSNSSLVEAVKARLECGHRLAEKKASMPHGKWLPWLEANAGVLGFSTRATAAILMKAAANVKLTLHLSDEDAVKLSRQMWGNSDHPNTIGSGENEWYTPAEYIEKARRVLGGIDLDPASSAEANETVKATTFYTAEDDGLTQDWTGRVWLNPPYSRDLMPAFVEKLKQSVCYGDVTAAIMVSHNNTDTAWFHNIAAACAAICFPATRIKFYRGEDVAAPTNGQMFIYLGLEVEKFKAEFSGVGIVVVPA